jgi:hypothetical protein
MTFLTDTLSAAPDIAGYFDALHENVRVRAPDVALSMYLTSRAGTTWRSLSPRQSGLSSGLSFGSVGGRERRARTARLRPLIKEDNMRAFVCEKVGKGRHCAPQSAQGGRRAY